MKTRKNFDKLFIKRDDVSHEENVYCLKDDINWHKNRGFSLLCPYEEFNMPFWIKLPKIFIPRGKCKSYIYDNCRYNVNYYSEKHSVNFWMMYFKCFLPDFDFYINGSHEFKDFRDGVDCSIIPIFKYGGGHNISVRFKTPSVYEIDNYNLSNWPERNLKHLIFYQNKRKLQSEIKPKKREFKPYVSKKTYLMKDNTTGLYKIGRSVDPKNRERTLQSEKPSIKMVWSNKDDFEYELHERYKNQRVRGEWFSLTETQVKYIATHY